MSLTERSKKSMVLSSAEELWHPDTRRQFLKMLSVGGVVLLTPAVFTACNDDDGLSPNPGNPAALDLSNDVGILNYAYALEQLEAAFYIAVVNSTAYSGMTVEQKEVFADLRNHEVIHREFLKAALGRNAIPALAFNPATVAAATANITVILQTAEAFEDLGVAAYNGAGKYLSNAGNLLLAGKIVSVEARHAAAIRDMRDALGVTGGVPANTRFAGDDVVIASGALAGLDVKLEPSAVLSRVAAVNVVTTAIGIGKPPIVKPGTPDFGPPSPTP